MSEIDRKAKPLSNINWRCFNKIRRHNLFKSLINWRIIISPHINRLRSSCFKLLLAMSSHLIDSGASANVMQVVFDRKMTTITMEEIACSTGQGGRWGACRCAVFRSVDRASKCRADVTSMPGYEEHTN